MTVAPVRLSFLAAGDGVILNTRPRELKEYMQGYTLRKYEMTGNRIRISTRLRMNGGVGSISIALVQ